MRLPTQGLNWSKATKAMASDAPLIGLNAPLRKHCLALDIFGALSRSSHLCCITKIVPFRKVALP